MHVLVVQAMLNGSMAKPADRDRTNFQLHWSVDFWRDFAVPEDLKSDTASIGSKYESGLHNASAAIP